MLALHEAFALAHVLEACSKIGAETVMTSASALPEDLPQVLICIGGPYSNGTTKAHLAQYCAGFHGIDKDTYDVGFSSGNQTFQESGEVSWAFIARLSTDVTRREGAIVLLWGATALATATAAYYFAEKARRLWSVGHGSIFVALNVNPHLGYRSVPAEPIDITSSAFTLKPSPATPQPSDP